MPFAIILALQAASPSARIATFDLAGVSPPTSITPSAGGCAATDDVTVCRRRADRHRLPLPAERQPSAPASHAPAGGMAALTPAALGGLFAGQRQCSKKEALAYGYGGRRDPLSLAIDLVVKLIDQDADRRPATIAPPPPIP